MDEKRKWTDSPYEVRLLVRSDLIDIGPIGGEMSAIMRLNGESVRIHIPAWSYDEESSTIPALPVYEVEDDVVFRFPPTCLGTNQCAVPKTEVKAWLKQEDRYAEADGPIRNLNW